MSDSVKYTIAIYECKELNNDNNYLRTELEQLEKRDAQIEDHPDNAEADNANCKK